MGNQKYTVVAGLRTDYHEKYGAFFPRLNFKWIQEQTWWSDFQGKRFQNISSISRKYWCFCFKQKISIASSLMPEEANNFGEIFQRHFISLQERECKF